MKKYGILCVMCIICLVGCKGKETEIKTVEMKESTEQTIDAPQANSWDVFYEGNLKMGSEEFQYSACRKYETLDYVISIKDYEQNVVQILEYCYDLEGDTPVSHGIYPKDVNKDGYEDILIKLGGHGNSGPIWACYVYDEIQKQFVYIEGFEELLGLEIYEEIRSIYYQGGGSYYRLEKYSIHDKELRLEGRLTQEWKNGNSERYISCTEEHYEDGKIVYKSEDISVDEINMEFWQYDIGEGLE